MGQQIFHRTLNSNQRISNKLSVNILYSDNCLCGQKIKNNDVSKQQKVSWLKGSLNILGTRYLLLNPSINSKFRQ